MPPSPPTPNPDSPTPPPPGPDVPAPPRDGVGDVPYEQRTEALRLLLTGSRHGPEHAVAPFLGFMRQQGVAIDRLVGRYVHGRLAAVCLVLPNPGRTGMVFISPASDRRREGLVAEATRVAVEALDPQRYRLVQALLEPTQVAEKRALTAAGFEPLATLLYLSRPIDRVPLQWSDEERQSPLGLDTQTWSESHRGLFERAIEASYEQTRDCPGLVGVRSLADVIEGHMATGRFDPELWTVYHDGGEVAAVTLFAAVQGDETYELVYLGVCPAYRGHGLGRRLLQRGITAVAARGGKRLCLAVDQDNAPARRLYTNLGFRGVSRKVAMIRTG